jgi:hypothetical protein
MQRCCSCPVGVSFHSSGGIAPDPDKVGLVTRRLDGFQQLGEQSDFSANNLRHNVPSLPTNALGDSVADQVHGFFYWAREVQVLTLAQAKKDIRRIEQNVSRGILGTAEASLSRGNATGDYNGARGLGYRD